MEENISNKDVFNWAINFLEQIPAGGYSANVYKTDTTHVIHLWDDKGNSFDFICPRAEFVDAPQESRLTPDETISFLCNGCDYEFTELRESNEDRDDYHHSQHMEPDND